MPLLKNAKHELFCRQYRRHGNATLAAVDVGYSAKTARQYASELMQKPDILDRISELEAEAEANLGEDRDMFDAHLKAIGYQNIDHFLRFTTDGDPIFDLSNSTRMQRAAISRIRVDDYTEGRGEDARDIKRLDVQFHPKLPALIEIGKAKGWLKVPEGGDGLSEIARFVREIQSSDAPFSGLAEDPMETQD